MFKYQKDQLLNNEKISSVTIVTSIHPDFDPRIWRHAKSLAENGINVQLICPWTSALVCDVPNIKFHVFHRVTNRIFRPILIPLMILRKILPLLSVTQIIHFHDIDLLPLMAFLSFFKPIVYDVHENYAEEMLVRDWIPKLFRKPLKSFVEKMHIFFPRFIRNIIYVVPQQKVEFEGRGLNCLFLPNYASSNLLNGYVDNYFSRKDILIYTGSHYEDNGSNLLVEIAKLLKARKIFADIFVTNRFTSKKFEVKFMQEIYDNNLDNIKVLNSVPSSDLMILLNQATIGIAPNLRIRKQEIAIPTKLFEYMAASLPIVSSDLPYQKELITRHKIGLLAQPEDPDSFVEAIDKLRKDKCLAAELGRNGRLAFEENYTWESRLPFLIDFYEKILMLR